MIAAYKTRMLLHCFFNVCVVFHMKPRQLARLLGALSFEERLSIISALISAGDEGLSTLELSEITGLPHSSVPIHIDYMASTDMVKVKFTASGKLFTADRDLLTDLFNFTHANFGAGMRLM